MSNKETKSTLSKFKDFMAKPMDAKDLGITYIVITVIAIVGIASLVFNKVRAGGTINMDNLPLLVFAGIAVLIFGGAMYTSSVKDMKEQEFTDKVNTPSNEQ